MLINLFKGSLGQVENRLDTQHAQLEVVPVENVCHVAQVEAVLFDLGRETRTGSHRLFLVGTGGRQTHQGILLFEAGEVFHRECLVNGGLLGRGGDDVLVGVGEDCRGCLLAPAVVWENE